MTDTTTSSPGWLDEVTAWIEARLSERDTALSEPIEIVREKPWSRVLRVPVHTGSLYCKAPAEPFAHEARLVAALGRWRADCILPLVAYDAERGWMLMPDGGMPLERDIRACAGVAPWAPVLATYVSLQIDLAPRVDAMLAIGVPDGRLSVLLAQLRDLLAEETLFERNQRDGLSGEEVDRLHALLPDLADTCHRLAAYGIPETLDNRDLNDGNVLLRDGKVAFIDWGDASVTHPFFGVRTVMVSAEVTLGLKAGMGPESWLLDAYLSPWSKHLGRVDLHEAFRLARRLWPIPAALTWARIVRSLTGEERIRQAYAVPSLLKRLLTDN